MKSGVGGNGYLYNGKELNEELGLDLYHYGARMYDPAVGRFTGVDPISDQFPDLSVYNYASNDPISNIDLHGLQGIKYYDEENNRHVVELNVRVVTVDNWRKKEHGKKPKGRVNSSFISSDVANVESILNSAFNGEKGIGRENSEGELVFFDISVEEFNVGNGELVTEEELREMAREEGTSGLTNIIDQNTGKPVEQISGVNFMLATFPGSGNALGINGANITKVRPNLKDDYITVAHETGHQLMTRTGKEEHEIMGQFTFNISAKLIDAILKDALRKKN